MSNNIQNQLKCILEGTYINEGFSLFKKKDAFIQHVNKEYSDSEIKATMEYIIKHHNQQVAHYEGKGKGEFSNTSNYNTLIEQFNIFHLIESTEIDQIKASKYPNDVISSDIKGNITKVLNAAKKELDNLKRFCGENNLTGKFNADYKKMQEKIDEAKKNWG